MPEIVVDAELFGSLMEAQVVIAAWQEIYDRRRPHSFHGYVTPEMMFFGLRPTTENRSKQAA